MEPAISSIEKKNKYKSKLKKPIVQANEINNILKDLHVDEFGPGEQPLKELAEIGIMLRKGISVDQVNRLHNYCKKLPILCIIVKNGRNIS